MVREERHIIIEIGGCGGHQRRAPGSQDKEQIFVHGYLLAVVGLARLTKSPFENVVVRVSRYHR